MAPALSNLAITVVVGPGILAHEYAHYVACRLVDVDVYSPPALRPLADDALLEHEPVDSFAADFPIAVAPFAVNSVLAFAAFWALHATAGPLQWVWLWLGVAFGFTALPSATDTASLLRTAGTLPGAVRPLGYLLAAPVWLATRSMAVAGVLTFLWTGVLFVQSAGPA
ncbi:hypothetical protein ACFQL1_01165 [Halomicroarcula sp. GCM10025709]|uniref:hypothetical protein n=1 Tax=Haloarcula TaxID=2237 RepID=UPI0024C2EBFA|nr:hypothetical protein [Halomicroarcula sp. YJ-61-S]